MHRLQVSVWLSSSTVIPLPEDWIQRNGESLSERAAVSSCSRTNAFRKLPNNTHLSGGILANTNRLGPGFEFLPTPVPVNFRYKTVEGRRNTFGAAIFHPHPETCWMVSFIGAGSGSAHYFAPWAVGALFRAERVCRSASRALSQQTEIWRSLSRNRTQLGFQMRREDCTVVSE